MKQVVKSRVWRTVKAVVLTAIIVFALSGVVSAQDVNPEVVVSAPQELVRLSWGAVFAGSVIALIMQLALNLLGISIGMMSINPEYGEDSASPKSLATGAAIWVGVSTLVSLFAGGWIAARFAGIPEGLDGALHGLMVWGVVTLVSLFFLTTTVGRLLTGVSTLVSHAMSLAGQTAAGVAHATAGVASSVAQGAANVAAGTARTAANAASDVANRASTAAEDVAQTAEQKMKQSGQKMPSADEVARNIQTEVRTMLDKAGVPQERLEQTAKDAINDVTTAAKQVAQNPADAERTISEALNRVLGRAQDVVNDADRQAVIDVMSQRMNINQDQARETLNRWEASLNDARRQAETTINQTANQVEQKVTEIRHDVEMKADQLRHEAERKLHQAEYQVREAAGATTDAIAKVAGAVFAAIVVGAVAAGLGGMLGAPEELPTAEIDMDEETGMIDPNAYVIYMEETWE